MGVTVQTRGALPGRVWDVQASRELGLTVQAIIIDRAFNKGLGVNDQPHKPYSTKPMTVTAGSETDLRLKAKGGLPAYGRGHPRRLLTAKGRARKSQKESGWKITGRHYEGGYRQYKAESRKAKDGGALVDLTLSGNMRRDFKSKNPTLTSVTIGFDGTALSYGPHTHAQRPWIGISPDDKRRIEAALNEDGIVGPTGARRGIIGRALDRAEKRRAGGAT